MPVLAPGSGETKTGRLWTYVRDDRPAGEGAAPAICFAYSLDRKGAQVGIGALRYQRVICQQRAIGGSKTSRDGSTSQPACSWRAPLFYEKTSCNAPPLRPQTEGKRS